MKKALFVATFAVGVIVGVVAPHILVRAPTTLAPTDQWIDTEEEMLKRMNGFQDRLDQLAKIRPDSVEELSKQTEAQRGIEDILSSVSALRRRTLESSPWVDAASS